MATHTQIVIEVDRSTLRAFRAECIRRGTTPTAQVGKYIATQTAAWVRMKPVQPLGEEELDKMERERQKAEQEEWDTEQENAREIDERVREREAKRKMSVRDVP